VTALMAWPNFHREMETEVDNQVAAPAFKDINGATRLGVGKCHVQLAVDGLDIERGGPGGKVGISEGLH
jgi:hypothetical protein